MSSCYAGKLYKFEASRQTVGCRGGWVCAVIGVGVYSNAQKQSTGVCQKGGIDPHSASRLDVPDNQTGM